MVATVPKGGNEDEDGDDTEEQDESEGVKASLRIGGWRRRRVLRSGFGKDLGGGSGRWNDVGSAVLGDFGERRVSRDVGDFGRGGLFFGSRGHGGHGYVV